MNELKLIDWLRNNLKQGESVLTGPGDDCAILDTTNTNKIAVTTDTLLEGTHFNITDAPYLVGRKSVAVNLSDMAAMGCKPLWAVTGMGLRKDTEDIWVENFAKGLISCAEEFSLSLVGGDFTTGLGPTSVTMTVIGIPFSENPIYRKGAENHDIIAITGTMGGSINGKHLSFTPRLAESEWLCKNTTPTAMMDVSDGIALDLRRLCRESDVGACLYEGIIPVSNEALKNSMGDLSKAILHALTDGEDFELLFTVSEENWEYIESHWPFDTNITPLGRINAEDKKIYIQKKNGQKEALPGGGYIHE